MGIRTLGLAVTAILLSIVLEAAVPATLRYVSPEVHADKTVTFRIQAPKAIDVSLFGGWMAPNSAVPLVKDADGLWSVTVGPLRPTVHAYWFAIDGATVLDEGNQYVRLRTGGSSVSMVEVPGDALEWAMRDVPHGSVEMNWVRSAIFDGETRQVWTYLPPAYRDNPNVKFPVLYLFHGAGELFRSWTESGKANLIFDNLLGEGKMKPMIVVMPYTGPAANAPAPAGPPAQGPGAVRGPMIATKTVDYVVKEVLPWAEATYRVAPGRKNRAIAGFSAGGALTASTAFAHLDLFGQMGMFSAPVADFSARFPEQAKDPKSLNSKLEVFWVGVGKEDPLATAPMHKFREELDKLGIRHTYAETEGAHEYSVWRWCLVQFAPLLFRSSDTSAVSSGE